MNRPPTNTGAGTGAGTGPSSGPSVLRAAVLVSTMVSTTFQIFVVSVLASVLLDEFGLSRFELGMVGSLNTAVGALSAPLTGRLTDRIGPRRSTFVAQLLTAAGFVLFALAGSVPMLLVSAVVLGIPQGWGNPATNALIAERVPPGRRGIITGVKQSGVQLSIFLAGVTLPFLADTIDWRGAMWVYAVVFGSCALLPLLLPATVAPIDSAPSSERGRVASYDMSAVWFIAAYAFLMGTGGGAIGRFLALFAEEEAGMSTATAGLVLAVSGLTGMGARVVAGRIAEHRVAPLTLLAILAVVATVVSALLLVTLAAGSWLLWIVALLFAIGNSAWNAVAMLAIIVGVEPSKSGRASGAVMFGFLGGLTIGAPIAGLVIDATGSYQLVWSGSLVLAAASAIVARMATKAAHRQQA